MKHRLARDVLVRKSSCRLYMPEHRCAVLLLVLEPRKMSFEGSFDSFEL